MEHKHTELCKRFINDVLPEIEKVMVVPGLASRIKRMELIEKFLSSIGCITPWHHPTPPLTSNIRIFYKWFGIRCLIRLLQGIHKLLVVYLHVMLSKDIY